MLAQPGEHTKNPNEVGPFTTVKRVECELLRN